MGSIGATLIDSILPRPFQSFDAQDNDRFVFVSRRRTSSFPAGHNFQAVARSSAGEERKREGGEGGGKKENDIRTNLRQPIFCTTCMKSANTCGG